MLTKQTKVHPYQELEDRNVTVEWPFVKNDTVYDNQLDLAVTTVMQTNIVGLVKKKLTYLTFHGKKYLMSYIKCSNGIVREERCDITIMPSTDPFELYVESSVESERKNIFVYNLKTGDNVLCHKIHEQNGVLAYSVREQADDDNNKFNFYETAILTVCQKDNVKSLMPSYDIDEEDVTYERIVYTLDMQEKQTKICRFYDNIEHVLCSDEKNKIADEIMVKLESGSYLSTKKDKSFLELLAVV